MTNPSARSQVSVEFVYIYCNNLKKIIWSPYGRSKAVPVGISRVKDSKKADLANILENSNLVLHFAFHISREVNKCNTVWTAANQRSDDRRRRT